MDNIERTKLYYQTQRELKGPMLAEGFKFIEADNHPVAGVYEGLAGLLDVVPRFLAMFEFTNWRIKEYTGGGDYTVALMEMTSQDINGEVLLLEVAEVFEWTKDGKLQEIKPCWFDLSKLERAIAAKKAKSTKA